MEEYTGCIILTLRRLFAPDGKRGWGVYLRNWLVDSAPDLSKVHYRKVWESICGEIPKGYVIHHINLNKNDNYPWNLFMMTRGEHYYLHCRIQAFRVNNPPEEWFTKEGIIALLEKKKKRKEEREKERKQSSEARKILEQQIDKEYTKAKEEGASEEEAYAQAYKMYCELTGE